MIIVQVDGLGSNFTKTKTTLFFPSHTPQPKITEDIEVWWLSHYLEWPSKSFINGLYIYITCGKSVTHTYWGISLEMYIHLSIFLIFEVMRLHVFLSDWKNKKY